jgi:predicted ribosomally synthesized peptide with SipW-like signal peptide
MKFKLLGALGVAAVGVLGLGLTNTGAWFTDQETVPVDAASGQLDIALTGDTETPISISGLMPGDEVGPFILKVRNEEYDSVTDSGRVKYRIRTADGSGDLLDVLNVRIVHGFCQDDPPVLGDIGFVTYTGPWMAVPSTLFESTQSIAPAGLDFTHCFNLYFEMDDQAGDTYQDTDAVFNIVVDATQPDNPGWAETS